LIAVVKTLLLIISIYYLTTFVLWFSHWFSHLRWSPLKNFHVQGHHLLYPSSKECLDVRFKYGKGWHDSLYTFIPWLGMEVWGIWTFLPFLYAALAIIEGAFIVWAFSYLHEQFHISGTRHVRSDSFLNARYRHFLHHDQCVNYAVLDHFWDRIFGTYRDCKSCITIDKGVR